MDRTRLLASALLALICLSTAAASSTLSWLWRSPPTPDSLTAIAYGGGIYVTAGEDGVIYTSHDGNSWSRESSVIGAGGAYLNAIYANGLFVLAGQDAAGNVHVTSSPDGVTWTDSQLSIPVGKFIGPQIELAFGNGTYILMGDGEDATSPDGVTWTTNILSFSSHGEDFASLQFANGAFIRYGSSGSHVDVYYSTDGVTWNASTSMQDIGEQGPFASDGNTFYLFFENANTVYTSTDGNHWTNHTPTGSLPIQEFVMFWDGAHFRSIGFDADGRLHAFSSSDGLAWTQSAQLSPEAPVPYRSEIAFDGSRYLTPTAGFVHILRSTDFMAWAAAAVASNGPQVDFTDILHAGNHFVAVGDTTANSPVIAESPDGNTWNTVYSGNTHIAPTSIAYGNGMYIVPTGTEWLSSSDGIHWSALSGSPAGGNVIYGNGRFVAFSGGRSVTSTDGRTFTSHSLPAGLPGILGFDGTRFVSISGDSNTDGSTPVYTSCDGITWTHSANIPGTAGTSFSRIRPVGSELIAIGSETCIDGSCDALGTFPVIASSKDASHWTAETLSEFFNQTPYATDAAFDGNRYYLAAGAGGPQYGPSTLISSTDLQSWDYDSAFPAAGTANALFNDGSNLYATGYAGDILSAPVSGGTSTPSGGSCHALSAIPDELVTHPTPTQASGGGEFDLFALVGLLGLLLARRRSMPA